MGMEGIVDWEVMDLCMGVDLVVMGWEDTEWEDMEWEAMV